MKKLIFGFGAIMVLLLSLGVYSLTTLQSISNETENIYEHPFKVSNAVKEIKLNIISIHHAMEDMLLSTNEKERSNALIKITKLDHNTLQQFKTIFDKYLGDKQEVYTLYEYFVEWKPIREKVIDLLHTNQTKKALQLTKTEGLKHIQLLNKATDKLLKFAENKADQFYQKSQKHTEKSQAVLLLLLLSVLFLSIVIAIIVIKSTIKSKQNLEKQMNLIDQHIMIASLDTKGKVLDISNEFARYLKQDKQDIMGTESHFFLGSDTAMMDEIHRTLMSGKIWEGEIKRMAEHAETLHFYATIIPNYNVHYNVVNFSYITYDIADKKALEILSITDKLTNLFNRRHFDTTITKELAIAKRQHNQLGLVILDIDYFKKYNDTYGHPEGDKVLKLISKTLSMSMKRPNDFLFRLGGEEFGILFTTTNKNNSIAFLEEIRKSIEALKIPHAQSEISDFVTISLGVKFISPEEITTVDALYQEADEALYQAKEKRNTLVVNSPIMIGALDTVHTSLQNAS